MRVCVRVVRDGWWVGLVLTKPGRVVGMDDTRRCVRYGYNMDGVSADLLELECWRICWRRLSS